MISLRHFNALSVSANLMELPPPLGFWGEVFATYNHSCLVRAVDGGMICIGDRLLDDGPITLRVDLPWNLDFKALGVRLGMATSHGREILAPRRGNPAPNIGSDSLGAPSHFRVRPSSDGPSALADIVPLPGKRYPRSGIGSAGPARKGSGRLDIRWSLTVLVSWSTSCHVASKS